jgi:hypothetical protein
MTFCWGATGGDSLAFDLAVEQDFLVWLAGGECGSDGLRLFAGITFSCSLFCFGNFNVTAATCA